VYLKEFNGQFFTNDEEKFQENVIHLLENILEDNDEISNVDQIYDAINDAKYNNVNPDNEKILSDFSQNINDAFDKYSEENPSHDYDDYDNEKSYGDEKQIKKLKSEVIADFERTLKSLGQDPNKSVIMNDIVRVEFDKQRFNLDGKVYAHVTDLKNNKGYEGYMNIKDIPTYFKNYKLFEEINRIKKLLK
jgi:hypothetical protein